MSFLHKKLRGKQSKEEEEEEDQFVRMIMQRPLIPNRNNVSLGPDTDQNTQVRVKRKLPTRLRNMIYQSEIKSSETPITSKRSFWGFKRGFSKKKIVEQGNSAKKTEKQSKSSLSVWEKHVLRKSVKDNVSHQDSRAVDEVAETTESDYDKVLCDFMRKSGISKVGNNSHEDVDDGPGYIPRYHKILAAPREKITARSMNHAELLGE